MANGEGMPAWLAALLGVIGTMATGVLTYLGLRRKTATDQVIETTRSDTQLRVELRKQEVEEERILTPIVQAYFTGMKERITQLESKDKEREEEHRRCQDDRSQCRQELDSLKQESASRKDEVDGLRARIEKLEGGRHEIPQNTSGGRQPAAESVVGPVPPDKGARSNAGS